MVLIVLAAICGPLIISSHPSRENFSSSFLPRFVRTMIWLSILAASLMKFNFRADLDPMESLKALPLRPWAVAVGQCVAPVFVLSLLHWVLIGALATAVRTTPDDRGEHVLRNLSGVCPLTCCCSPRRIWYS